VNQYMLPCIQGHWLYAFLALVQPVARGPLG
jgi:hypothetical protein